MKYGLTVDNLNFYILNDISFSLESGTFTAIIGNSGSGKSLLLKCIAGLCNYNGKVIINGNAITKQSKVSSSIGFFTDWLDNCTAFENIMKPLINLGFDESSAKKAVYDLAKKLEIENLLYKEIDSLSYSEKKMVGIAKSIVHRPSIILLDNAFDSLDIHYKNKVISYLKSMKKSTVIFTTNNSENLMIADNIIIIRCGKIVEKDTRNKIFENESVFTKNKIKLPFIIDLSHKLNSYELVNHLIYSNEDMVNELWK